MPSATRLAQPSSAFLRSLRRALLEDFEAELVLACKIAVLSAAGYRRAEIARVLNAPQASLRAAELRVKRAADRLDAGEN